MNTNRKIDNNTGTGPRDLVTPQNSKSFENNNSTPYALTVGTTSPEPQPDQLPLTETGWSKKRDVFLLGTNLFGSQDYRVDAKSAETGFVTNQRLEDWKDKNRERLRANHLEAFSVLLALAGPIWTLTGKRPRAFHFYGKNHNAKRMLIDLGNSVYGDPNQLYCDWNLTRTGAEALLRQRNHSFVGLGDLPGTATREAALIGQSLSNGRTRARARHDGSATPQSPWTLSVASTGHRPLKLEVPRSKNIPAQVWDDKFISIPIDGLYQAACGSGHPSSDFDHIDQRSLDGFCSDDPYGSIGSSWIEILVQRRKELQISLIAEKKAHAAFVARQHAQLSPTRTVTEEFGIIAAGGRVCAQMGLLPMDEEAVSRAVYEVEEVWLRCLVSQDIAPYETMIFDLDQIIQQADEQHPNCRIPELNSIANQILSDRTGTFIKVSDFRRLCSASQLLTANQNQNIISQNLADAGVVRRKANDQLSWRKWSSGRQSRYLKIDTAELSSAVRNMRRCRNRNKKNHTESHRGLPQEVVRRLREKTAKREREESHND